MVTFFLSYVNTKEKKGQHKLGKEKWRPAEQRKTTRRKEETRERGDTGNETDQIVLLYCVQA